MKRLRRIFERLRVAACYAMYAAGKRRIYRGGARAVRGAFCRNGICGFGGELALALLVRLLALRIFPFVGGYRVQVRGH